MTITLASFLLIAALVLFILAALNVPSLPRLNYGWAGMACVAA
jgi:hypothetical protein